MRKCTHIPEFNKLKMKALVLFAHPVPESFSASLNKAVLEELHNKGWDVDDLDLYQEGFDPILSEKERRIYHDEPENTIPVKSYVERLQRAEALILVFPVWIFGFPAILKGFFDRVCVPGVAFKINDGKLSPNLQNINTLVAVTTYGGTRVRAWLAGDPPRKIVTRSVKFYCQPKTLKYLALYDMNRADRTKRTNFLSKVRSEIKNL